MGVRSGDVGSLLSEAASIMAGNEDAAGLLHGLRGYPLPQGCRGRPPADIDALRDILLRTSRLAEDLPEIVELDLNPVMALSPGKGCRVVDARIRVAR